MAKRLIVSAQFPAPLPDDITQTQTLGDLGKGRPSEYLLTCQATGHSSRLLSTRTNLTPNVWVAADNNAIRMHANDAVKVNGQPFSGDPLVDGDTLEVDGASYRLQRSPMLAYLEGLTSPHKGDCWALDKEPVLVGRPGKRDNQISLMDQTVSRAQAQVAYSKGRFMLMSEARSTVNGRVVEEKVVLRNGDLLGFGHQLMRFQSSADSFGSGKGTILFCDVWDYSGMFTNRSVQDVAAQMNEFYEACGAAVENNSGLVLRYVGDALLSAFSDKGHADSAVAAAIELHTRLEGKNQAWAARGLPALRVGVGISSGEFAMGHVGFAGYIEFGALGQDVNMAARIEKLTRDNGARILLGQSTQEQLTNPASLRSLGPFALKGIEQEIEVFEVLL